MSYQPTRLLEKTLCFFISFIMAITAVSFSQSPKTADFLIVENPARLRIYDKYEQEVDFLQLKRFVHYIPLQTIVEEAFLSDNFTPCLEVKLDGQTYYLLKNEDGNLIGIEAAGDYKLYKNCEIMGNDIVETLLDQTLFLVKAPTFKDTNISKKYFLNKGVKLRRIFRQGNFVYVYKPGINPDYGWVYLNPHRKNISWKIFQEGMDITETIPPQIVANIEKKIAEINSVLKQLFAHFNKKFGTNKMPPQWVLKLSETRINCSLNFRQYRSALSQSTRYLMSNMENSVLGTPLSVFHENGEIEIRRKFSSVKNEK